MKLSETHIFKMWCNDQAFVNKILTLENQPAEIEKQDQKTQLERRKFVFRIFAKVWSGMTKYIISQCSQGRVIDTGIIGMFSMEDRETSMINSEISFDSGSYFYQPTAKFLDDAKLSLFENEFNINPYSEISKPIVRISHSSIAAVWDCTSDTVSCAISEFSK